MKLIKSPEGDLSFVDKDVELFEVVGDDYAVVELREDQYIYVDGKKTDLFINYLANKKKLNNG